jgi:5-methylcytosine-specific restriction protein A
MLAALNAHVGTPREACLRLIRCACNQCAALGRILSTCAVGQTIKAHRGDMWLFWDVRNWRALSKPCHDRKGRARR